MTENVYGKDGTLSWILRRRAMEDRIKRWIDWFVRGIILAAAGAFFFWLFRVK
jgi:hypothetical protein